MASPQPSQCLVSLEAMSRQFLFFCDGDKIVYYHLPAGAGNGNFSRLGSVSTRNNAGALENIKSSSNWFAGTVYENKEVRLYISVKTKAKYLLKEFCATVKEGTDDLEWTEGSFSRQTSRPVIADSLITAMTETNGNPTVIYQSDADTLVRLHQGLDSSANANAERGWIQNDITFTQ